jgi:hypothetical protein
MVDRAAIIADAVNDETTQGHCRCHSCSVKGVNEHVSEVPTAHNRARVLSIELHKNKGSDTTFRLDRCLKSRARRVWRSLSLPAINGKIDAATALQVSE